MGKILEKTDSERPANVTGESGSGETTRSVWFVPTSGLIVCCGHLVWAFCVHRIDHCLQNTGESGTVSRRSTRGSRDVPAVSRTWLARSTVNGIFR